MQYTQQVCDTHGNDTRTNNEHICKHYKNLKSITVNKKLPYWVPVTWFRVHIIFFSQEYLWPNCPVEFMGQLLHTLSQWWGFDSPLCHYLILIFFPLQESNSTKPSARKIPTWGLFSQLWEHNFFVTNNNLLGSVQQQNSKFLLGQLSIEPRFVIDSHVTFLWPFQKRIVWEPTDSMGPEHVQAHDSSLQWSCHCHQASCHRCHSPASLE